MDIEWKKIALYAIAPALIAGLFSVAPKLYDILTDPKAELTYQQITGPELQGSVGFQKIISVVIENSGKRSLSNVFASVSIVGGKIEAQKIDETSGLKPISTVSSGETSLILPKLHPGEKFTISALGLSDRQGVASRVVVRSDEVLGAEKVDTSKKGSWATPFLSSLLTVISVFLMALVYLKMTIRGKTNIAWLGISKPDVIFYIAAKLGIPEIINMISTDISDMTYRRFADLLLAYGNESAHSVKAEVGLICLLLVNDMNALSAEIVVSNLKALMRSNFNPDIVLKAKEIGKELKSDMSLREGIDEIVRCGGICV